MPRAPFLGLFALLAPVGCSTILGATNDVNSVRIDERGSPEGPNGYIAFVRRTEAVCNDSGEKADPRNAVPWRLGMFQLLEHGPNALSAIERHRGASNNVVAIAPGEQKIRLCYLRAVGTELECAPDADVKSRDLKVSIRRGVVSILQVRDDAVVGCSVGRYADLISAEIVVDEIQLVPRGTQASQVPSLVKLLRTSENIAETSDENPLYVNQDDLLRRLAFDALCRIGISDQAAVLPVLEKLTPSETLGYLASKTKSLVEKRDAACLIERLR